MSDKLKQGIAVVPEFVEGESVPPAKLNTLGSQLRAAAENVEKAVGDLYGDQWPYSPDTNTKLTRPYGRSTSADTALTSALERFTDIANLARLIGPSSSMNPRMMGGVQTITQVIDSGLTEFSLRYPVSGTISATNPTFADASLTTLVASSTAITAAGEYYVSQEGKVWCSTPTAGSTCTYDTDPSTYSGGMATQGSTFNVIPDPNQLAAGSGITVTGPSAGVYTLTLPTCTAQQANIEGNAITLDGDDVNNLVQLEVPKVLQDNFSAGEEIPSGFLHLKNYTTGEAYTNAVYKYNTASILTVESVDLSTELAAGHDFVIVTVGADITTSIDDIRRKMFHTHDRSFGEPFVDIDGISGFTRYAGASGAFVPSEAPSNFAPQYLHRDGWQLGVDDNINDQNVMRGNIVLGIDGEAAGAFTGTSGAETYGLVFGNPLGSVPTRIFKDNASTLQVDAGLGTALTLRAGSGNDITFDHIGGAGSVVLASSGIRGDVGTQTNAVKFYRKTGSTLDMTAGFTTIDCSELTGKTIVSVRLMVEMSSEPNSTWFSDGNNGNYVGADGRFDIAWDATDEQVEVSIPSSVDWGSSENYELFIVYRD